MPENETKFIVDLVRHITGQDDVDYVQSGPSTWSSAQHEVRVGSSDETSFIVAAKMGEYAFYDTKADLEHGTARLQGHVEDTSLGNGRGKEIETFLGKITGTEVQHKGWIDFSGILRGSLYIPSDRAEPHAFFVIEGPGEDAVSVYRGDNPRHAIDGDFAFEEVQPENFQQDAFWSGSLRRLDDPAISVTCRLKLTNPDVFARFIGVDDPRSMDASHLANIVKLHDFPTNLGLSGIGMGNVSVDGDMLEFDITASVADWAVLVRETRLQFASCWGDREWYPSSPEDMLFEIGLGSNVNDSPDTLGFEIIDWKGNQIEDPSSTPSTSMEP